MPVIEAPETPTPGGSSSVTFPVVDCNTEEEVVLQRPTVGNRATAIFTYKGSTYHQRVQLRDEHTTVEVQMPCLVWLEELMDPAVCIPSQIFIGLVCRAALPKALQSHRAYHRRREVCDGEGVDQLRLHKSGRWSGW